MASSAAPKKKRKVGTKKPRKVQARQKITAKQKNMSDKKDDEDYKDDDSEDPSDLENLLELMDSKVDDVDKEADEDPVDGGDR